MIEATLLRQLWVFMPVGKRWWLLPLMLVMLLVGALLTLAHRSAPAPFLDDLLVWALTEAPHGVDWDGGGSALLSATPG